MWVAAILALDILYLCGCCWTRKKKHTLPTELNGFCFPPFVTSDTIVLTYQIFFHVVSKRNSIGKCQTQKVSMVHDNNLYTVANGMATTTTKKTHAIHMDVISPISK